MYETHYRITQLKQSKTCLTNPKLKQMYFFNIFGLSYITKCPGKNFKTLGMFGL